jgi:hypothetical protein
MFRPGLFCDLFHRSSFIHQSCKEKSQGTSKSKISPTPYFVHILGKTFTYLIICIIQFLLMVAVGIYLFPYMDLPAFDVSGKMVQLITVTLFQDWRRSDLEFLLGTLQTLRNSRLLWSYIRSCSGSDRRNLGSGILNA